MPLPRVKVTFTFTRIASRIGTKLFHDWHFIARYTNNLQLLPSRASLEKGEEHKGTAMINIIKQRVKETERRQGKTGTADRTN